MAIYIANENGDWWEFNPEETIYVLDTDKITKEVKDILEDEYSYVEGDGFYSDGIEDAIMEYGTPVKQGKLLERNKNA